MARRPLLVTTEHRGVFFGYGEPTDESTIQLERVRMCIYWPESQHGVLGLASQGPLAGAKVGPAVPSATIRAVTAVAECTEAAAAAWETEPWS